MNMEVFVAITFMLIIIAFTVSMSCWETRKKARDEYKPKGTFVIPTPIEEDQIIRKVPKGKILTIQKGRSKYFIVRDYEKPLVDIKRIKV